MLGVAHGGLSAHVVLSDSGSCFGRGMLGDVRHAATRPAYHSPERHDGEGISPADDTWAIAVTLYYWFAAVAITAAWGLAPAVAWAIRVAALGLAATWLLRALPAARSGSPVAG